MKRLFISTLACALAVAGFAVAQTSYFPMPSGVGTANQVLSFTDGNNVQGTAAPSFGTSVTVGSSGTAITQIRVLTATVTQFTLAAQTCVEKAYTVSGLTTADKVLVNPAYTEAVEALLGNFRAAAADSLEVTFCNPHAQPADPETGTLNVVAIRS